MFSRLIIRDDNRPLTWFVSFEKSQNVKSKIEAFSDDEAQTIMSIFRNTNINCFKEKHNDIRWDPVFPYYIVIVFDNEADEAAFIVQNS